MSKQNGSEHKLRYSMIIAWSVEDDAYVVTVPELPGCMTHGATYEEAARQGQDAMEGWVEAQAARGRRLPEPKLFAFRWWNNDGALGEPEVADEAKVGELAHQRG